MEVVKEGASRNDERRKEITIGKEKERERTLLDTRTHWRTAVSSLGSTASSPSDVLGRRRHRRPRAGVPR